ncbi:MAG: hypothetical protein K9M45_10780, partial [Kiritimatiellales bacterium]|nr:hypothetical protein [Kiritimatiellales bacterium]
MKQTILLVLITAALLVFPPIGKAEVREFQPLDGSWEIIFDKQNEGRAGEWQKQKVFQSLETRCKIDVPSCWEEIEKDYEGVGFYGTKFKVSNDWKGKVVRLQFDAVNYVAEVYVNDTPVGRHEGGYGNFEFRIDDLLKFGKENFLSLRVIGPIVAEDKVIDGIGQSDMPHWRGAIAGGIWQSVRLVATGTAFVDDVFIVPQLKNDTAKVQVVLQNTEHTAREVEVDVSIFSTESPAKAVAVESEKLKLVPGTNEVDWTLKIRKPRYWSPDDPHLYTAKISIDGQDVKSVRFG